MTIFEEGTQPLNIHIISLEAVVTKSTRCLGDGIGCDLGILGIIVSWKSISQPATLTCGIHVMKEVTMKLKPSNPVECVENYQLPSGKLACWKMGCVTIYFLLKMGGFPAIHVSSPKGNHYIGYFGKMLQLSCQYQ